ncbi:hypothetical protein OSSY52_02230 [Tepiditoga spiralis]|uniref:ABC transporter permease n=1 Tax=Tepiditoga spiralis TaxID=2108365 RepID=A0A7G1G7U0_9BACT|nr:hypothetical protein OSSY52_02230 [Tepiditoga spiralis]
MNEIITIFYKEFQEFISVNKKRSMVLKLIYLPIMYLILLLENRPKNFLIFLMFILFIIGIYSVFITYNSVQEEKNKKTLETLLSIGLKRKNIFVGKIILPIIVSLIITIYNICCIYIINLFNYFPKIEINLILFFAIPILFGVLNATMTFLLTLKMDKSYYMSYFISATVFIFGFIIFYPISLIKTLLLIMYMIIMICIIMIFTIQRFNKYKIF